MAWRAPSLEYENCSPDYKSLTQIARNDGSHPLALYYPTCARFYVDKMKPAMTGKLTRIEFSCKYVRQPRNTQKRREKIVEFANSTTTVLTEWCYLLICEFVVKWMAGSRVPITFPRISFCVYRSWQPDRWVGGANRSKITVLPTFVLNIGYFFRWAHVIWVRRPLQKPFQIREQYAAMDAAMKSGL